MTRRQAVLLAKAAKLLERGVDPFRDVDYITENGIKPEEMAMLAERVGASIEVMLAMTAPHDEGL